MPQAVFEFREQALLYETAVGAEGGARRLSLGENRDDYGWFPFFVHHGRQRRAGGLRLHDTEVLEVMQALNQTGR